MNWIRPLTKTIATLVAAVISVVALWFDLSQPLGVAVGMSYIALPLIGLLARSPPIVVVAAIAGTALTGAGFFFSPAAIDTQAALVNRAMSGVLVWIVALISLHHMHISKRFDQHLREQALTDPLTGLYNRRHVFTCIQNELKRYERYGDRFSIILIDADHFKQVNDTYGHVVGDATLRWIATVCGAAVRETDVVARFGGEEFIILLPHTSAADAAIVAERIRGDMHESNRKSLDGAVPVTLSLGVAEVGPSVATFDGLLKAADDALYEAKHAGRDRVSVKPPAPRTAAAVDAA